MMSSQLGTLGRPLRRAGAAGLGSASALGSGTAVVRRLDVRLGSTSASGSTPVSGSTSGGRVRSPRARARSESRAGARRGRVHRVDRCQLDRARSPAPGRLRRAVRRLQGLHRLQHLEGLGVGRGRSPGLNGLDRLHRGVDRRHRGLGGRRLVGRLRCLRDGCRLRLVQRRAGRLRPGGCRGLRACVQRVGTSGCAWAPGGGGMVPGS